VSSEFAALVASLDYPLFIVTAAAGDEQAGCLIGFATQASIRPSRFLACLSKKNRTFEVAQKTDHLVVHVVGEANRELAELFGGETGDEVDKFASVRWHPGPGGAPVLEDCERWFAGRVLDRVDLGDHVGFLLEPVTAGVEAADGDLLTFQDARDIDPGHPA
jgi:flavin reductase (DIM6/NTAB) family NADH-FMN oxidoreductase RutF